MNMQNLAYSFNSFSNEACFLPSGQDIMYSASSTGGIKNMSFSGVVLYGDMVYGFGDSKASITDHGIVREDGRRPCAVKVFSNEYFVVSSFSTAELRDENGDPVFFEEWIPDNISNHATPWGFLSVLRNQIHKDPGTDREFYGFVFGAADDNGLYIQSVGIQNGRIDIRSEARPSEGRAEIIAGGDAFYANNIQCDLLAQFVESKDDTETAIREYIECLIKEADKSRLYNPVGGTILVKPLRPVPRARMIIPEGFI